MPRRELFRAFAAETAPAPSRVDRDARVIRGYAVITRGEALGHDLWIDEVMLDQVVEAGNAKSSGLKVRFTHPGLCSDGLGKFLGRARAFVRDGDVVRADLHFSGVAGKSPEGDLSGYLMDLADEDDKAFGTSIVFSRDFEAEEKLLVDGGAVERTTDDDWGGVRYWDMKEFVSPDPLNEKKLRHARLAELSASDVVDEPAANPAGMFSEGGELAARAERVLAFITGKASSAPSAHELGMEPARIKTFFDGFLARHCLEIKPVSKPKTKLEEKPAEDPKKDGVEDPKTATEDPKPAEKCEDGVCPTCGQPMKPQESAEGEDPAPAESGAPEKKEDEKEGMSRFNALAERFKDRPQFVIDQFRAGASLEQAELAFKDLRIAELEKQVATGGGAQPAPFSAPREGSSDFMTLAKAKAKAEKISEGKAIELLAREQPELHQKWLATQRK
jgi:hypothetical protein